MEVHWLMEPQIYIMRTIQSQMSSHLSQALQNIEEHTILIPLLHKSGHVMSLSTRE